MVSQESHLTIRAAIPQDAAILAHMHAESFKVAYLNEDAARNTKVLAEAAQFITPDRILSRANLVKSSLEHSDNQFFYNAIDQAAIPVGLIYGHKTDKIQELSALYIAPSYFGTGAAQDLTTAFIEWCDPAQRIELGVVKDNERAQRFYQKMGFRAVNEPYNSHFRYLPEIKMVLPIREEQ